jgi:hypothetical protein
MQKINGFLTAASIKIPTVNFSKVWHIGQALNGIFARDWTPKRSMNDQATDNKKKCEISVK